MKRTIKFHETPDCTVQFSDIKIDPKTYTFMLTLGTKEPRQRKFHKETVTGKVTPELMDWFTKKIDEKVPVKDGDTVSWTRTGNKVTRFSIVLSKNGIEAAPNILPTLIFESDNRSTDYYTNPFKLVINETGATLSLVTVMPRKKVVFQDPVTGDESVRYIRRKGNCKREYYKRLLRFSTREVEVATDGEVAASRQQQ